MHYVPIDSEQYIFDRNQSAFGLLATWLFKALLFSPLLITGYFLASQVLQKGEAAVLWIASTFGFAYLLFLCIYFLKGMVIGLVERKNLFWIVIFLFCIAYTCIGPAWFVYYFCHNFMLRLSANVGNYVTWIITIATSMICYKQYDFLSDGAPIVALLTYRLGYRVTKAVA